MKEQPLCRRINLKTVNDSISCTTMGVPAAVARIDTVQPRIDLTELTGMRTA
jgi:hypothetical protein